MSLNSELKNILLNTLGKISTVRFDVPLSEHTTFRTGGRASIFIEPDEEESLPEILRTLHELKTDFLIIGGGSNLLISDEGLDYAVIKISKEGKKLEKKENLLYASAFMSKENFISEALRLGYGGVSFTAGVPGSVGGGIFMNAGTFMGCFIDILKKIRIVNSDYEIEDIEISKEDSNYRKMNIPEKSIILGGFFELPASAETAAIGKEIDEIIKDRWSKHPMEFPSAGSVFKNPEGHSAWKLVNDCGLKGYTIGGAMVSEKHTNFIINKENATSSDVFNLINHVKKCVMDKFSISLETEVKIIGNFN